MFEIRIEYISLDDNLLVGKILAPLITMIFTQIFPFISLGKNVFHFLGIARFSWDHWKNMPFVHSYSSLRLTHNVILSFSINCDKKLIFLLEKFSFYIILSFNVIAVP